MVGRRGFGDVNPAPRDVHLDFRLDFTMVFAVSLANPANNFVKTVVVKVAHVTPVPGGYLVGGAFTTPPLTYQELTAMVM